MNERSLRVLEYPKIIAMLAQMTAFAPGRELAERLQPLTDAAAVEEALDATAEALALLERGGSDLLAGARDVREAVRRAGLGGVLSPAELLDVAATAGAVRRARRALLADPDANPRLARLALRMGSFVAVEEAVAACIGEDGQVLDRASPKLAQLRTRIRTLQARARERLEAALRAAAARNYLQEVLITVRNGRYVVPVKQEHRHDVPGIVHDTSASGATVFVEPMAVVELNNEISAAKAEEEREVARILGELSRRVGEAADGLLESINALAELDLAVAKARLARHMRAERPKMNEDGWISIRAGRHPLLSGPVVPVDVWVGRDFRVLVITGPNTGGKTVTLKTIGLFCLMAQAGLFVPAAPGTELSVFRGVFADIGDEQSIEQNLSTFSAHMANIVEMLKMVDRRCLVLLDELGAGTDPQEGAALAMALLEHLQQVGAVVVATTHHSELKAFVHSRPGMENASMEFDPETLAPTYRLQMGLPGRSNALEIAARLGLPQSILERARGQFLRHENTRVEELLRSLQEAARAAEEERRQAERLRAEAERIKAEWEAKHRELQERRRELLASAQREAKEIVRAARQEAEAIIAELRRRQDEAGVKEARAGLARLAARLAALEAAEAEPDLAAPPGTAPAVRPLRVGDTVLVKSIRQPGRLHSGPDAQGQWTVIMGNMRLVVPEHDLVPLAEEKAAPAVAQGAVPPSVRLDVAAAKRASVSPEVHLRGMTVDEALGALEKYLDDALLAGLDKVRVVHGKGTGALRQAVHGYLRAHPRVKKFYFAEPAAGGHGVTVAELE
jgi:MutS2 family protein